MTQREYDTKDLKKELSSREWSIFDSYFDMFRYA